MQDCGPPGLASALGVGIEDFRLWGFRVWGVGLVEGFWFERVGIWAVETIHRLLRSSFLGLPYRVLNINHKKELLRSLWVSVNRVANFADLCIGKLVEVECYLSAICSNRDAKYRSKEKWGTLQANAKKEPEGIRTITKFSTPISKKSGETCAMCGKRTAMCEPALVRRLTYCGANLGPSFAIMSCGAGLRHWDCRLSLGVSAALWAARIT